MFADGSSIRPMAKTTSHELSRVSVALRKADPMLHPRAGPGALSPPGPVLRTFPESTRCCLSRQERHYT